MERDSARMYHLEKIIPFGFAHVKIEDLNVINVSRAGMSDISINDISIGYIFWGTCSVCSCSCEFCKSLCNCPFLLTHCDR